MKIRLMLAVAVVLIGATTGLWMLGSIEWPGGSQGQLRERPGPSRPPGEIPAEGHFIQLLEEAQRIGYRLPPRSVPLEQSRELAESGFQVQKEALDPEYCSRLGGYRGEPVVSWACRTRFPPAVKQARFGREAGSESGATPDGRYAVWYGDLDEPLPPFDPSHPHQPDVWHPVRGGFSIQLARRQPLLRPSKGYRVRYPIDPDFLSRLNWADSPLSVRDFIQRDVDIDGDLRPALFAPAPTTFVFPLRIPPAGRLQVAIGLLEEGWLHSTGVDFEIALRSPAGNKRVLHTKRLDPRARPEHRRWHDLDVDLSAFAGRRMDLILSTRAGPSEDASYDVAAFASPIVYRPPDRPTPVILIDLDTLRADHLDVYGYSRPTAPVLSEFARSAVVFDQAIAQAPYTLSSQMSILTSLRGDRHGVETYDDQLAPEIRTLASYLAREGYFTKAITDAGAISFRFGFNRGFHSYSEYRGHRGVESDFASDLLRRFRGWIDSWRPHNVFLFVHSYEPHIPYAPPRQHIMRIDPDYWESEKRGSLPLSPRALEQLVARYDGEIHYTDEMVGTILSLLKARGLFEDSLIVVLSDHGEEFYDHGRLNHGHSLYDELIRVPLLIRFPRGAHGGRRIRAQVEMIDVLPTILDALGQPVPEDLDGVSLMRLVREDPDATDTGEPRYAISGTTGVGFSVRSRTHKLIRMPEGDSFFSLLDDPKEQRDLYDPADPQVQEFVRILEAYQKERPTGTPAHGAVAPDLDPDLRDQLRALGYLP
ncbi:MAG: sulfatase [Myxococcota bacterium]